MKKKLILVMATLALSVGAYLLFSSGDRIRKRPPAPEAAQAVRQFVTPSNMQASQTINQAEMNFSPGDQTRVRIYDENTGRLKYQLEAEAWEPVSNNDFHLKKLLIQVFMPRGEISYISADEADVTLARKSQNRFEPRSGRLTRNVKVTIDRTTAKWREANPQLAARDAHPDDLIYIDLEEARFDLDQAELKSDGPIRLDSVEARIENVRGLTVQWNQVDNRIDVLRFAHGGTMALRRGGRMIDFALPGGERSTPKEKRRSGATAAQMAAGAIKVPRAQAMKPMRIEAPRAEDAASAIRLEGGVVAANQPRSLSVAGPAGGEAKVRDPEALASDIGALRDEARAARAGEPILLAAQDEAMPTKRRIHTYRALFTNEVVVEQMDGLKSIGRLEADKLEINFDFGRKQREMSTRDQAPKPTSAPADAAQKPSEDRSLTGPAPTGDRLLAGATPMEEDKTKLVLTWNGPLELRPVRVDPALQTGERFDAIANGSPVRLRSEQGKGYCDQLVYRHEKRQVWLSGKPTKQVELAFGPSQKLKGREVFFDQKRGLARVEGEGEMRDEGGSAEAGEGGGEVVSFSKGQNGRSPIKPRKPKDTVVIRWSKGVDIELGTRPVRRQNPSTGVSEEKQREYLRRAWFHGDVSILQGEEALTAGEVAITFGLPRIPGDRPDYIQHLNLQENVRLARGKDVITAEHLDAQMILTADGRNIPRIVDASGDVLARQDRREIRAEKMHVVMGMVASKQTRVRGDLIVPDKSHVGIEAIDASGNVYIHDPEGNLRIRDADTLSSVMRNGNELVRATITSDHPDRPARARTGEVAIHGQRIEIDAEKEQIDVPGPGRAYMLSQRDFGGRRIGSAKRSEPLAMQVGNIGALLFPFSPLAPSGLSPELAAGAARALLPPAVTALLLPHRGEGTRTRIVWKDEMHFRLQDNYGVFLGQVRTDSDTFALCSDKLTVRFGNTAPPEKKGSSAAPGSSRKLDQLVGQGGRSRTPAPSLNISQRKRPVALLAEGHARALGSEYAPATSDGRAGRLLSRMQINGGQIAADLVRERMSVPGAGTLLIEDYKFEPAERRAAARRTGPAAGPLMSAARGDGPSQTAVRWKNSMDFYVDQNLIAFDKDVEMIHLSGRQIVLRDSLAKAMQISSADLRSLRAGRRANLTCGYLLLEFQQGEKKDKKAREQASVARATDLERLIAKHAVHLQEGTRSLMGDYVQYLRDEDEILVEGAPGAEARIFDQDEREQRMNMWRGPVLIWNRQTNRVEAPQATIRTSRR